MPISLPVVNRSRRRTVDATHNVGDPFRVVFTSDHRIERGAECRTLRRFDTGRVAEQRRELSLPVRRVPTGCRFQCVCFRGSRFITIEFHSQQLCGVPVERIGSGIERHQRQAERMGEVARTLPQLLTPRKQLLEFVHPFPRKRVWPPATAVASTGESLSNSVAWLYTIPTSGPFMPSDPTLRVSRHRFLVHTLSHKRGRG